VLPADPKYEADRSQIHNFLKIAHRGSPEWSERLSFTLLMLVILKGLFPADESQKNVSLKIYWRDADCPTGTGKVLSHMTCEAKVKE